MITSGLTDGLETYELDALANGVEIFGVFRGAVEPISIAEVRASKKWSIFWVACTYSDI